MRSRRPLALLLGFLFLVAAGVRPAHASFHFMQIEQVIGGVNGDLTAQAIQLRMRTTGQNLVSQGRLIVRDAAGLNPVLIVDMTTNVSNGGAGNPRVLIASSSFQSYLTPVMAPDFIMTNVIPASYLAAGSLTFEDDFGTIYWRLSWGGSGYTGPGTLDLTNDPNGNANPPFPGACPSSNQNALKFGGTGGATSNTNAADYTVPAGGSNWTKNSGASAALASGPAGVGGAGEIRQIELGAPAPNPGSGAVAFTFSLALPRAAHVRVGVFEASGQRVRTLIDRDLAAGRATYSWDARDDRGRAVRSGAYYLRLESGDQRLSRKLMVIR